MTAAEWVRGKKAAIPHDLNRAMSGAVEGAPGGNLTAQLVAASRSLGLRIAAGGCPRRGDAVDLLTFDALITGAMESAASGDAACEAAASAVLAVISEAAAIE